MTVLLPVAALLTSVAVLLTGHGLQGVLLPVRASIEGFGTFGIAVLGSSYFAGFTAGCVLGPRLVQRVGHIRTFTAMTAIAAAAAVVYPFACVPLVWWALRSVSGFCLAVLYMVIESWLNDRATRQTRGAILSAYMVVNMTVLTLGQLLLPLYDPRGMELFAISGALLSLSAVPVALSTSQAPPPLERAPLRLGWLLRLSPIGLSTSLLVGAANGAFWGLAPEYARTAGLSTTGVAVFMSATVLGGALCQAPLGWASDRTDRRWVILLAGAAAVGAGGALAWRPPQEPLALFGLAGLWGAAAFPIYSLGVAVTNDRATPDVMVEASAALLLLYGAGAIAGPIGASLLAGTLGARALYAFAALVHGVLLAAVVSSLFARAAPAVEDQGDFGAALVAARTVSTVFTEPADAADQAGLR